jgi:diguanylate cyclase
MDLPYADDDIAKASELLRLTLPFLAQHKIPPSPLNYRLGYEYVTRRDDALCAALDEILASDDGVDPENAWALYRRFFVQDSEVLDKIRQELHRVIIGLQGHFESSSGSYDRYQLTLGHFASILDGTKPLETIASEVESVINETHSMEAIQRRNEASLACVMDEVEALRRELDQVKKESMTDALTGVANRKAFNSSLESLSHDVRAEGLSMCILLVDIDHFKRFNDTYGHLVGDRVLRFVATTIQRCVKGKDAVARFGGEEFAVILPETELAGAEVVAEQIRTAVSDGELRDKHSGQRYGRITVSIGVGQCRRNELATELLERVDRALYRAKDKGRNRTANAA